MRVTMLAGPIMLFSRHVVGLVFLVLPAYFFLREEDLGLMVDELESHAVVTQKGLAVALVTISRYLAAQQPEYRLFLRAASDHAAACGLPPTELAFLELLIKSIT